MIEEDFFATIKFKNGEEIFCKVAANEEDKNIWLIVFNPIMVTEIKTKNENYAYKIEPWLKTTTDDMFIINFDEVLLINESSDKEIIELYEKYLEKKNSIGNNFSNINYRKIDRKMGYISNIEDAKLLLEKIFNQY